AYPLHVRDRLRPEPDTRAVSRRAPAGEVVFREPAHREHRPADDRVPARHLNGTTLPIEIRTPSAEAGVRQAGAAVDRSALRQERRPNPDWRRAEIIRRALTCDVAGCWCPRSLA